MTIDEKTSAPKARVSPLAFLLLSLSIMLSTLFLANIILVLRAARMLDEVGAQCAYRAAQEHNLVDARQAVEGIAQSYKPDGFFLSEAFKSEITFYKDDKAASNTTQQPNQASTRVPTPFATVKTSCVAWIPGPQFFAGAFERLKVSDTFNPNLVRFSAMHSSPCLTLYDETQKSGRTSI